MNSLSLDSSLLTTVIPSLFPSSIKTSYLGSFTVIGTGVTFSLLPDRLGDSSLTGLSIYATSPAWKSTFYSVVLNNLICCFPAAVSPNLLVISLI